MDGADYYSLMLGLEKSETKGKKRGETIIHYATILHQDFQNYLLYMHT